jgi:hypothetical protein
MSIDDWERFGCIGIRKVLDEKKLCRNRVDDEGFGDGQDESHECVGRDYSLALMVWKLVCV